MSKPVRTSRSRSCSIKDFQNNLSDINRYLSYYVFISSQFIHQNSEIIDSQPEKMTAETFIDNKLSEQFNVKLLDLEKHTIATNRFVFDSVYLNCCFGLDNYFKEAYKAIQKIEEYFLNLGVKPTNFPEKIKELTTFESLNQIVSNLSITIDSDFTEMDYLTFEYFRLRRNTIAHRNVSARYNGSIKSFVQTNGNDLNNYWRSSHKVIRKLDFTSTNLQFEEKDEVVDVINILRDTVPKLDQKILCRITDVEWVEFLFNQFRKDVTSYNLDLKVQFIKSFGKYTNIKQNRIFDDVDIDNVIFKKGEVAQRLSASPLEFKTYSIFQGESFRVIGSTPILTTELPLTP